METTMFRYEKKNVVVIDIKTFFFFLFFEELQIILMRGFGLLTM